MNARAVRSAVAAAALLALAAGCGAPPRPPELDPGLTLDAAEIARRLDGRASSFRTVKGGMELTWLDGEGEKVESLRGSLSWAAPDSLRLRGIEAGFFTAFDLVAVGNEVRIDVPREGLAVFGDRRDGAWRDLPLSAAELEIALLAHPCAGGRCLEGARAGPGPEALLAGEGWTLELDASTGLPVRWLREADGVEIRWDDWTLEDGVAWPRRVELARAGDDGRLEVRWGRVQLDREIPSSRFDVGIEGGREVLTPAEARTRWKRLFPEL